MILCKGIHVCLHYLHIPITVINLQQISPQMNASHMSTQVLLIMNAKFKFTFCTRCNFFAILRLWIRLYCVMFRTLSTVFLLLKIRRRELFGMSCDHKALLTSHGLHSILNHTWLVFQQDVHDHVNETLSFPHYYPFWIGIHWSVGFSSQRDSYVESIPMPWRFHGPLTRYVNLQVAHPQGRPGTFSPPPTSRETASYSDPGMHYGIH